METYQTFYKGLINSSDIESETCSCTNGIFDTINVNSLTASHIYGIICEVINTSILFPEIGFSFDPAVNTFSIYLYDDAIPLSRIRTSAYSSTATASTLVFRDSTNSTTMSNLTVSGLLTATANSSSTVSRSNTTFCHSDSGNQEFYLVGSPNISSSNYYELHGDLSGNISFNPNTHRLSTGFLRCTESTLSTMTGGLTVTGILTATANSSSTVSRSNQLYIQDTTANSEYNIVGTASAVTGYTDVRGDLVGSHMSFNPSTNRLTAGFLRTTDTGNTSTIAGALTVTGIFTTPSAFITSGTYGGGTIGASSPSLYLGGVTGNKQGMIRYHSGTTAFTTYTGTDSSGHFYIDPTDGKNLNLCTKPVASSSNLNIGASSIPTTITIYGNTSQTGTMNLSTGNMYKINNVDLSTTNIGEGTNLYYTTARVNTYLTTTNPLNLSSSTGGTNLYGSTSSGSIYIKSNDLTSSTLISLDNTTGISTTALPITIYNGAVKSVDLTTSGCNIATGLTYKINGTALRTSEISENTNLYYTDLRARTAIVPTDTVEINHTYSTSTGVLTSDIVASSIVNSKLVNSYTVLGSTTLSLGATNTGLSGMSSIIFSSMSLATLKIVSGGIDIPYNNVLFAKLGTGTKSTALIGTNWQRVENASGSSKLEVKFYPYNTAGTLKLEASITTFYTSTNTGTFFNIQVLKNSASTTTVATSANMVHSLWFNRNITGGAATVIIPLLGTYSFTGGTVGDYYTISVYFNSATSFANGSTVGRATDDIPTTLVVTQIA